MTASEDKATVVGTATATSTATAGTSASASTTAGALSKSTSHFIEEGDLILVYLSHNRNPLPVVVHAGATHVNSFGAFPHSTAFLGKPFGSRVNSLNGRGFIYILRPTPEMWTLSLPHRTQILYQADIAFITQQLNLTPGSRIIEAGTGSGSFTHALARTVGRAHQVHRFQGTGSESVGRNDPREQAAAERAQALSDLDDTRDDTPTDGRVFSFEFHAQRFGKAKVEFAAHGLSDIVRMTHRNVCKEGFALSRPQTGLPAEGSNSTDRAQSTSYPIVDAVFLDLPAPWEAVPFVPAHLNQTHTTKICCFSPCIEQVLKTVQALNAHGFTDVQTWEVLMREIESTPLAKATPAKYDYASRNGGYADLDDTYDDEEQAEGDALEDNEEDDVEGGESSAAQKRKATQNRKQSGSSGGKKRKREEGGSSAAAANKARWGLERPRDVTSAIERIISVEERKEVRRLAQVSKAKAERERRVAAAAEQRSIADDGSAAAALASQEPDDEADDVPMDADPLQRSGDADDHFITAGTAPALQIVQSRPRLYDQASVYGRLIPEMRGHTSYLTFGTMLAGVLGAEVKPAPTPTPAPAESRPETANGHASSDTQPAATA